MNNDSESESYSEETMTRRLQEQRDELQELLDLFCKSHDDARPLCDIMMNAPSLLALQQFTNVLVTAFPFFSSEEEAEFRLSMQDIGEAIFVDHDYENMSMSEEEEEEEEEGEEECHTYALQKLLSDKPQLYQTIVRCPTDAEAKKCCIVYAKGLDKDKREEFFACVQDATGPAFDFGNIWTPLEEGETFSSVMSNIGRVLHKDLNTYSTETEEVINGTTVVPWHPIVGPRQRYFAWRKLSFLMMPTPCTAHNFVPVLRLSAECWECMPKFIPRTSAQVEAEINKARESAKQNEKDIVAARAEVERLLKVQSALEVTERTLFRDI